jgi:nucleotide-binding universal stress UspA family protein
MPLRDVLVVLDEHTDTADRYACDLASRAGAKLTGVAATADAELPAWVLAEIPGDAAERLRHSARERAQATLKRFGDLARNRSVEPESRLLPVPAGEVAAAMQRAARHFDLCIVNQPSPEGGFQDPAVEAVLFGSGRPLLVVPYIWAPPAKFSRVTIAWDGSRTAARAVGDALPLLALADGVDLVSVGVSAPDEEMLRHLRTHGLTVEPETLTSVGDVASTLLSHAADAGTDLIIMGGYGHSRIREVVLGGTTRGILQSMTVPVLMSH